MTDIVRESQEDFLPEVSFDVKLGKRVECLDFDYELFAEHLKASGLENDQISQTKILFRDSRELEIFAFLPQGVYKSEEDKIVVKVLRPLSAKRVNDRFVHETSHRVDDCLDRHRSWATITSNLGTIAAGGVAITAFPVEVWSPYISSRMLQVAIAGFGLVSLFRHFIDPNEKRAYKAQSQIKLRFLTIR